MGHEFKEFSEERTPPVLCYGIEAPYVAALVIDSILQKEKNFNDGQVFMDEMRKVKTNACTGKFKFKTGSIFREFTDV